MESLTIEASRVLRLGRSKSRVSDSVRSVCLIRHGADGLGNIYSGNMISRPWCGPPPTLGALMPTNRSGHGTDTEWTYIWVFAVMPLSIFVVPVVSCFLALRG